MFSKSNNNSIVGPATQALERSLKRQRTMPPIALSASSALEAAFNLDQVFNSLKSPEEESFPSIGWSFDDSEESELSSFDSSTLSSGLSRKRSADGSLTGLVRSKSLRNNLLSLAPTNCPATVKPVSKKMHASILADMVMNSSPTKKIPLYPSNTSLKSLSRRSHFGASRRLNEDLTHNRATMCAFAN